MTAFRPGLLLLLLPGLLGGSRDEIIIGLCVAAFPLCTLREDLRQAVRTPIGVGECK